MAGRLLIVAAEIPPVKGIGRLRPIKFCQHLANYGWETAVLTLEEGDMQPVDRTTLLEIPSHTRIYRAKLPQPKKRLVHFIKSLLARKAKAEYTEQDVVANGKPSNGKGAGFSPSLWLGGILGIWDRFAQRNLLIPDDLILWAWPAVDKGLEAIEDFKPDLILATAPYFTDLIIGARLSRLSGIPWIADYRDLWTGDVLRDWVPMWRRRLELAMERKCLRSACAVISVSEPKTSVLRQRLNGQVPFLTLTNGYDAEEFAKVAAETGSADIFRVVYAGRLFKNRRGYELLEAVGLLLAEKPQLRERLRIEYYGGVTSEIQTRMAELIESHQLKDVVEFFPDVSYQRSKALQKGASALLLIVDSGETSSGVIPGKLFEYIAAGRPILCIASPGATTEIIQRGRLGMAVAPADIAGLRHALENLIKTGGVFQPDQDYLAQFERGHIVERLAVLLNGLVEKKVANSAHAARR